MGRGVVNLRVLDRRRCYKYNHTHKYRICKFTGILNMTFAPHIHKETQSLKRNQTSFFQDSSSQKTNYKTFLYKLREKNQQSFVNQNNN